MDIPMAENTDQKLNVMKSLGQVVTQVAGARLPQNIEMYFNQISHLNLRKENVAFEHLPEGNERERWVGKIDSRLGDIRRTLRILDYHCKNVRSLEQKIGEVAAPILRSSTEQRSFTVAAGDHEKLDAEYHAYHFAVARTVEYFTQAVSFFFRMEIKSLRRLLSKLEDLEPSQSATAVAVRVSSFESEIGHFWKKSEDTKPTRDWLAHYHYVEPGCLNMSRTENGTVIISLQGGPNNLNGIQKIASEQGNWDDGTTRILTPLSDSMAQEVKALTNMLLRSFGDLGIWTAPLRNGIPAFRIADI